MYLTHRGQVTNPAEIPGSAQTVGLLWKAGGGATCNVPHATKNKLLLYLIIAAKQEAKHFGELFWILGDVYLTYENIVRAYS